MRVALIGNFEPEFSTENDLKDAMERLGWTVRAIQSGERNPLVDLIEDLRYLGNVPHFIVWVRTASLWDKWGTEIQWKLLAEARRRYVPVVGYHLDRWWGLKRQDEIRMGLQSQPFFHCDLLVTADGGHDDQWKLEGINHVWFPPGVSERWCEPGRFQPELETDIVFVGSWQAYGHREWPHRAELVNWLQKTYGDRVAFYPKQGQHAVRGLALNDVYWSAKVVVGDSCLAPKVNGDPMTHYCSDRIPETLGRGGLLCHPQVEGLPMSLGRYFPYELYDFDGLEETIHMVLDAPDSGWSGGSREGYRRDTIDEIREHHTYTVRMRQLEDLLRQRKFIS
jgi:hypothetical protein